MTVEPIEKKIQSTAQPATIKFKESLIGRIRNLALSPNAQGNALIPLFEAISNSMHSLQERFGQDWAKKGEIRITVFPDAEGNPLSFKIEDNGIGLNDRNFESFMTFDSIYKLKKGGKGVGRLTWLKVFKGAKIESTYRQDDDTYKRSFDFILNDDGQIQNHTVSSVTEIKDLRTTVFLDSLQDGYKAHCPKKTGVLAKKIIGHFLKTFLGNDCPTVVLSDVDNTYDLQEMLNSKKFNTTEETFQQDDITGKLKVEHVLLEKSFIEGGAEQRVYFSAHERAVKEHVISNQVGLTSSFDYEGKSVVYVGLVSGGFLDDHVSQERNHFNIDSSLFRKLEKEIEVRAIQYLEKPIAEKLEIKKATVEKVLTSNPRFRYLVTDTTAFAKKLPMNAHKPEEIFSALSIEDYRETKKIDEKIDNVLSPVAERIVDVDMDAHIGDLVQKITEQGKASLAQYIVRRKAIIDLLEQRLGYRDENKEHKYKEDAIHGIICPLKKTSDDIEYGDHNLWLVDDRLAYYDFLASDTEIKKFAKESESGDRPDIILFKGCSLLHRVRTNQPMVIVEFKRPARTGYSDNDDPIKQVYGYIKELREKKIEDKNGALITQISNDTPFYCYIICDVTPKMMEFLKNAMIDKPLPGGRGYHGYNTAFNAYVEVIQYSQLVEDARLRQEAFFEKLDIN